MRDALRRYVLVKVASKSRNIRNPEDHPAVLAWNQIGRRCRFPVKVEELNLIKAREKNPKSRVYRLHGALANEKSLIAKICRTETAVIENLIYSQIFTQLPLQSPKLYGSAVSEVQSKTWLFLEDAGEVCYSPKNSAHSQLVTEFFAIIHTQSQYISEVQSLPDRGTAYYFSHLEYARNKLRNYKANQELSTDEHDLVSNIEGFCTTLNDRWGEIEKWCDDFPKTLVHGDFVSKNVRFQDKSPPHLLVFDWEHSGIGMPGPDLASSGMWHSPRSMQEYFRLTQSAWPDLCFDEVLTMARLGSVFRLIAATSWACKSLSSHYPKGAIYQLKRHRPRFEKKFAQMQWSLN
jgi:hypothetical protein